MLCRGCRCSTTVGHCILLDLLQCISFKWVLCQFCTPKWVYGSRGVQLHVFKVMHKSVCESRASWTKPISCLKWCHLSQHQLIRGLQHQKRKKQHSVEKREVTRPPQPAPHLCWSSSRLHYLLLSKSKPPSELWMEEFLYGWCRCPAVTRERTVWNRHGCCISDFSASILILFINDEYDDVVLRCFPASGHPQEFSGHEESAVFRSNKEMS